MMIVRMIKNDFLMKVNDGKWLTLINHGLVSVALMTLVMTN